MTTTTVKTIGTTGDYSTIQAWEDAAPANLVTSDVIYRGELQNQNFTAGAVISGQTTDATRYMELTTVAGASFRDNANVQTNALRANSANGAIISVSANYGSGLTLNTYNVRISNLQISCTGSPASYALLQNDSSSQSHLIDFCILESGFRCELGGNGTKVRNCLITKTGANASAAIARIRNGVSCTNTTFVTTHATATTNAILFSYASTATFKNCYLGGDNVWTASGHAPTTVTTSYCNDSTSLPTGFTTAAFSTSSGAYFQNITAGSHDFRIASSSTLIDVGTTDATNAPNDIAGTARPSGSAYDVGAWEYVSSGGTQALTPSLFSETNAFYTPVVGVGAVALTPSLYSGTNTFYSQTLGAGAVDLVPPLLSESNTFYTQELVLGAANLLPPCYAEINTFYTPAVGAGVVGLTAPLFTGTATFYSQSLGIGTVALAPTCYTGSNTFYTHAVTLGAANLLPGLFQETNTFYSPFVVFDQIVTPSLFVAGAVYYTPALGGSATLPAVFPAQFDATIRLHLGSQPSGILSDPVLYAELVTIYNALHELSIGIDSIHRTPAVYDSAITYGQLVTVTNVSGNAHASLANASASPAPAFGFCSTLQGVLSGRPGDVQATGVILGFTGLVPGTVYYLSETPGGVTSTKPVGAGKIVQEVGVAMNTTTLSFRPTLNYTTL